MDYRLRDYLIRAHSKVIAHYHQVLRAPSLAEHEREPILRRLAIIEEELEGIRRSSLNLQIARAA